MWSDYRLTECSQCGHRYYVANYTTRCIDCIRNTPLARCGRSDPHGAHVLRAARLSWCAGNVNVIASQDRTGHSPLCDGSCDKRPCSELG